MNIIRPIKRKVILTLSIKIGNHNSASVLFADVYVSWPDKNRASEVGVGKFQHHNMFLSRVATRALKAPQPRVVFTRTYAKSFQLDKEHTQDDRIKRRSFKWLIILGVLALGSSVVANSQGIKRRKWYEHIYELPLLTILAPRESLQSIVEENEQKNKEQSSKPN